MDGGFSNSRAPGSDKPCWGILNNFFSNKTHDVSLFFIGLTFHSGMRIINVYNCPPSLRQALFAASLWGFYLKCYVVFAMYIVWEMYYCLCLTLTEEIFCWKIQISYFEFITITLRIMYLDDIIVNLPLWRGRRQSFWFISKR